jgi:hypothetical protein
MTYAVAAYALAAVIWIAYLRSLRARAERIEERRKAEPR